MWTNPFSSFGWPNEIPSEGLSHEERLNFTDENLSTIFSIIEKYPYRSISKAINAAIDPFPALLINWDLTCISDTQSSNEKTSAL